MASIPDLPATDLATIRATLRSFRVVMKRPADAPAPRQSLVILADARAWLDRINRAAG